MRRRTSANKALGVVIHEIAVASGLTLLSAYGYKQTLWAEGSMSAFGGKADIEDDIADVC